MTRTMVRVAVFGMLLGGAIAQLISFAPTYHIAGRDVTWLVGTAQLAAVGAVLGLSFAFVRYGLARWIRGRRRNHSA